VERQVSQVWQGVRRSPVVRGIGTRLMHVAADGIARAQGFHIPPVEDMGAGTRLRQVLGWYEHESLRAVELLVHPGMVAVDVGAHIGYYTRRLARRVGRSGRVLALEPHEPTFRLLEQNLPRGRFPNVELVRVAAGEAPGEASLVEFMGSGKHSLYDVSLLDAEYRARGTTVAVKVARVDDLLRERGLRQVHFVKLDIEGAEQAALRGMSEVLAASPAAAAIVEYNSRAVDAAGSTPEQFVADLTGLGFDLVLLAESGEVLDLPADPRQLPDSNYVNVLGVKGMAARRALAEPLAFRDLALAAS
jgi:FkbM family methyltransferase